MPSLRQKKRSILIVFLLLLNISLPSVLIASTINNLNISPTNNYTKKIDSTNTFSPHEITLNKVAELQKQVDQRKMELKIIEEKQNNINRIENILNRYNSPMAGYGEIIFRKAEECGGDFKVLVAISGNESRFGNVPYKIYNPYGYLDGKQYSGWNESLEFLSCVISQRFLKPCNNDLNCIINKYGGSDTDKEKWIRSVQFFINQI